MSKNPMTTPDPEWRESKNPEGLAQAVRDGRQVECTTTASTRWWPTSYHTTYDFHRGISSGVRYRIGPKKEEK